MSPSELFQLPTLEVARNLIGWELVHETPEGVTSGIIVETEAYVANDPANHAFKGPTPRNSPMFGPPGHAYVYFTYGMHYCCNLVTAPEGIGEAVLIRALIPQEGITLMQQRRNISDSAKLCSGPGNVCKAMNITLADNNHPLTQPPLFIREKKHLKLNIVNSMRIGISKGQDLPYRFYLPRTNYPPDW